MTTEFTDDRDNDPEAGLAEFYFGLDEMFSPTPVAREHICHMCEAGDENCRVYAQLRKMPVADVYIQELDYDHQRYHFRLKVGSMYAFAKISAVISLAIWAFLLT